MSTFTDYKKKLDAMSHKELFSFYKNYNNYVRQRTILKQNSSWTGNLKKELDSMDQRELSLFDNSFKSYIQRRLISS